MWQVLIPSPPLFHINIIDVWSLTCLLWYDFFLFQKKLSSCSLNETSQTLLLKDTYNPQIALTMVYFEILYDRMPLISTKVTSSYIYWYIQKTLGATQLTLEKYIFICSYIYVFYIVFWLSIMSIFTSVFQKVWVCFYFSIYFVRDYESSFIGWTSTISWFLRFSWTQTKRKCKAFHFTCLCKI